MNSSIKMSMLPCDYHCIHPLEISINNNTKITEISEG